MIGAGLAVAGIVTVAGIARPRATNPMQATSRRLAPRSGVRNRGPNERTWTQQCNAVSEGLALGLLALGYSRLADRRADVDVAFAEAFLTWTERERFPRVKYAVERGIDGEHVATRATRNKHTTSLFWVREGVLVIEARKESFDPHSVDDLASVARAIGADVGLAEWVTLAHGFASAYDS